MQQMIFLGCQYPLVNTPKGTLAQSFGVQQIKADLLQLLLTNPGERVMLPTFGTPLRKLIFEPNDPALTVIAKQMIADSIAAWEPRIVVSDIFVTSQVNKNVLSPQDTYTEIDAILYIQIQFVDPANIQQIESLKLEVPLGG